MSYDRIYGATPEMASLGLKTRGIGEDITAQLQSSLSNVESQCAGWHGQASKAFESVEFLRKGNWGKNTQNIDTMADAITKTAHHYSNEDDRARTIISEII